jgi:cytoskeletal protein RodZ
MESFSSELKKAREAKHLTLSDVSDATAINVRFLEALEQGNTSILPAPYIRAFIKEYAAAVGLDPGEVLRHFEQDAVSASTAQAAPEELTEETQGPIPLPESPVESNSKPFSVRVARYAILAIALAAVGVGIWNLWRPPSKVAEIPLSGAINQELPVKSEPRKLIQDSLTLSGTTNDSVWILVQIDNLPSREYLMRAGQKFTWRAQERYIVTLGNAGGVDFRLNDKHLGTLGKRGAVVRNLELSRRLLSRP